jgi:pimeloyl-ACP methyl ester carboxylesterase
MPWLSTPDVALRYEIAGEGSDTLLLMHEMGGTLESWDGILPLLLRRYRVLRYDQRGAGLSEKPRQPFTLADAGNDAVALLDALDVRMPVVPIGTAVGGAVALHVAAAHPGRVRAVIATSPATGVPAERRPALLERAALLEREGTRATVDPGLDRGYPPALRSDAARFAQTRAQRLGADPFGQAATMRMLAGMDMAVDLASITCPALLVAGRHDGDRPPEGVEAVASAIRGSTYRVLDSGHFMAIQTPELLAAEIFAFLNGALGQPPP